MGAAEVLDEFVVGASVEEFADESAESEEEPFELEDELEKPVDEPEEFEVDLLSLIEILRVA